MVKRMDAAVRFLGRKNAAAAPKPVTAPVAPVSSSVNARAAALGGLKAPSISTQQIASGAGTFISYLFYLSAAAFFIFLLLTFVHFTITPIFKLSAYDKGVIGVSTKQDKVSEWMNVPPAATEKTSIENPKSCDYTISFDVFIKSEYKAITAPRVLFYRSSAIVDMSATAKTTDLGSLFPTTNILAYIDPTKNDLIIYAVTSKNGGVYVKEAIPPISNVPVGKPFRLSIAFMPNFVEVYIDGKLSATKLLSGTPVTTETQFWPPPTSVADAVSIGKFYYWPRALMASELQSQVSSSADFFKK